MANKAANRSDDGTTMNGSPATALQALFPVLYGACFVALLWQAFRVMARGYRAVPPAGNAPAPAAGDDRTGRLTIHPELLDSDGQLTQEDLLTVRFSGEGDAAE